MTTAIYALVIVALVLLDVRLALWVWCAWRDHRSELEASSLIPRLVEAHKLIRQMTERLKELEQIAVKVQRQLWDRGDN